MLYSREDLLSMGFRHLGQNVEIDTRTTIDNPQNISLGDFVKIGSFVILGGDIKIASYVHIGSFTSLYGGYGIEIGSFVAISNYVRLISHSDDYSGDSLTAPFVPDEFKPKQYGGKITIKNHCIIGSGSCILPSVTMENGTALGAMSLLKDSTQEFGIYAGIPAKKIKERSKKLLKLEEEFLQTIKH
ncbi:MULTISPECIES: acyltransferase [Helicobacter]|uniref:Acyltransferase n=1 Tax=Helicobacter ibis TaxID=2962633 RepID=A0ABT4VG86_9HELI|nr:MULTISPECIES: acyltransferase [Helicobacter]MDA3967445.1 acyltransferase [Helicobacter sp. WB40]MDA3969115.1 acyltransferase [Helicobacter ibis]